MLKITLVNGRIITAKGINISGPFTIVFHTDWSEEYLTAEIEKVEGI